MAPSNTVNLSRRPKWAINGARDCRACEGHGEVAEGVTCLTCLGSATMPADWGRDPLHALRDARRTPRGRVLYPRIRKVAMRPVRLPGAAS